MLMCMLTVTQAHNLKSAVAKDDLNVFVIASPDLECPGVFLPIHPDS